MKTKKTRSIVSLLLCVVMVLGLCACGNDTKTTTEAPNNGSQSAGTTAAPAPAKKTRVSLGTAGSSGAYFIIGSALANIINEKSNVVEMTAEVTDGSAQNLTFLSQGDIQFGMCSISTLYEAYHGTGKYKDKAINLMAIGNLHPSVFQVVVLKDANIKTIKDMVGKKIVIGAPGSGTRLNVNSILQCCGISDSDINAFDLSIGESVSAMKDRNIDGAFIQNAVPTASLIELANDTPIDLISFTDEEIKAILAANPLWAEATIPSSVYKTSGDIHTVGINNVMFCSPDVSEEVAYEVTKMIYENLEALTLAHDSMSLVSLQMAPIDSVPMHPGAIKFYKEKGLIQ
ncbi:MAG: TAXI family TRAP transporter solute-binding subunit [Lachnospiraceae bacterium]|nr:TAXI family TRAP transporter solute-binding subunit [Lachnospiraceae bacterium]